ncbi:MAG: ubiquinol-cytochrome c reductase iron-sulfur subunit [Xanthomonadales bacterium]|nr:ubiquinol-cytochrome c reductase iron-sulfur subunit [Xanthomonadales bacterium]
MNRRSLLLKLTLAGGGLMAAALSVPFLRSLLPSEKAKNLGAPVTVDISSLGSGEVLKTRWRGRTILVFKRTEGMLRSVGKMQDRLLDDETPDDKWQPAYVDPEHRGLSEELIVLDGTCTHLGCVPSLESSKGHPRVGAWFEGGLVCACHFSAYDFAGRVVKGPAPRNLRIPPYRLADKNTLIIGESPLSA